MITKPLERKNEKVVDTGMRMVQNAFSRLLKASGPVGRKNRRT
jgi:hypothetical protein